MAEEEDEGRLDLNLYLGLPRSPRHPRSLEDLGSDLALGSLPPLSSSSATQESRMASELPSDPSPTIDGNHNPHSPRNENHTTPFTPMPPTLPEVEVLDAPYTPPTIASTLPAARNESLALESGVTNVPYSPTPPAPAAQFLDGTSFRQELLQYPEFRFQRLIESNNRWRHRRFRSTVPYGLERSGSGANPFPITEQLVCDIMSSQRSLRSNGKDKVDVQDVDGEDSEEESGVKSKSAMNFECNICLDVAKEPVVTSCGHLFCWPCLYQWLHVHSGHRECPVCKGEVVDANITPIYGRGSSETDSTKKSGVDGDLGLKIPARPRGHRLESLRQHLQRPISRRLGEGMAASWRRIIDEEMRAGVRFDGNRESSLLELFEAHRRAIARIRERRTLREEGNAEGGFSTHDALQSGSSTPTPQLGTVGLPFEDGDNTWQRLSLEGIGLSERLAAISADLGRVVERLGGSTSSQAGPSASSINPQNPQPDVSRAPVVVTQASDQASASSTIAVIEGDVAVTAVSTDPNSAGSSRPVRRRGRSRASSSLDVDGMLHERKRRRLN